MVGGRCRGFDGCGAPSPLLGGVFQRCFAMSLEEENAHLADVLLRVALSLTSTKRLPRDGLVAKLLARAIVGQLQEDSAI